MVECNHFAEKRKDIFGKRNVMESFRFHPTFIVLYLKKCKCFNKFEIIYVCTALYTVFIAR